MTTTVHEHEHKTDDELLEDALSSLDGPEAPDSPPGPPPAVSAASPTLQQLDKSRRPKVATVCETCPNSVWFASPAEVKCYCRVMFLVSWSTHEPNQITACDGASLGRAE
ncbi:MAG TPA: conjugal transfer protein TraH [Burkholderiaceae bacterium]